MKLRILLFALIAFPAISQTTYQSSKYKPVWYSSTYEKTHATYATFDTSSIKAYFTPLGKPEYKMIGPTANTLFYVDSTGSFGAYAGSATLPWVLKTAFDDSLNNAHTITGAWKFSGAVGAIPAGQVSIGRNATNGYIKATASNGDSLSISVNGTTTDIVSTDLLRFASQGSPYYFRVGSSNITPSIGDVYSIGAFGTMFQKGYFSDSLYVGGKGQTATFKWGQMRQMTDTDSSGVLTMDSGNPVIKLQATDADNSQITVNTYDQMLFQNASGGYDFDAMIRNRDTDSDTFAVNPKGFSATNTMATGAIALQLKDGATNLFSVDTTGNSMTAGYAYVGKGIHAYGGFQDSSVTLDLSEDTWLKVTNPYGTLWGGSEADGITMSVDTLIVSRTGDYSGMVSITFNGSSQKEYQFRVYNVTQAAAAGFVCGGTGNGTGNYVNVAFPVYLEATANDRFIMQVQNTSGDEDIVLEHGEWFVRYYHE